MVKELQYLDTVTPFLLYNICLMVPRETIQNEVKLCLCRIKDDMAITGDTCAEAVLFEMATMEPPEINIRQNVSRIPKAKSSQALIKLP